MSLLKSHRPAYRRSAAAAWIAAIVAAPAAGAATPDTLLAGYVKEAGATPNPEQGQLLFNSRHGRDWSCASCHGAVPTAPGRHAATGKPIAALAPAFNPERFTEVAKADKWFRRNCNDVVGRECTSAEKADVLSWLIKLKP